MHALNYVEFLQRIPKTELHCHLVGTLRAQTLGELAGKHGLALPRPAQTLYEYRDFYDFIDILRLASSALRTVADFERAAYEVVETGYRRSNLRHIELFFNPHYFYRNGTPYPAQIDGLCSGLQAAERDFGVTSLLIPSIDREWSPAAALELVQEVIAHRTEKVVGIGLDGPERAGPPQTFVAAYEAAGRAGLKRTAHVCEDNQTLQEAPPQNLAVCLDALHCDRLDHGYNLLADPRMVKRAQESGVYFTACARTSVARNKQKRLDNIRGLVEAGLNVTLNTDDPEMFHTDLAESYVHVMQNLGWNVDQACKLSLAGVDASWLDKSAKCALRRSFKAEIDALLTQYRSSGERAARATDQPSEL
jgi:adenosine deaminase